MFINCHACRALVATDPVSDLPPAQCPRCGAELRSRKAQATAQAKTPDHVGPGRATAIPTAVVGAQPRDLDAVASAASAASPPQDASPSATVGIAGIAGIAGMLRGSPAPSGLRPHVEPASTAAPAIAPRIPDDAAPSGAAPPAVDAPRVTADASTPTTPLTPTPIAASVPATAAPRPGSAAPSRPARPSPSFAASQATASRSRLPRWLAPVVILVLVASLLLQVLLADRARFAASATWRPLLTALCGTLGCQLPPWHDPAAFVLLTRDVRAHPGHAGALRVTATFRNDARWAQAWPQLQLRLSDINGQDIASRGFTAEQYLADTPHSPLIASGQTATIRLDVREPATEAVSFAFDLR